MAATQTAAAIPSVDSFTGESAHPAGPVQQPTSLQIELGSAVVLHWTASHAPDGVELTDPASASPKKFAAGISSATVTPAQEIQDYWLVALSGKSRSLAKKVHVSTHEEGAMVSAHLLVNGKNPASSEGSLRGIIERSDGTPLPRWPFELLDANGKQLTSAALAKLGGVSALLHQWGWFVTDADGRYWINNAPAGSRVRAMSPLEESAPAPAPVAANAKASAQRPLVMQLVQRAEAWNAAHPQLVSQFVSVVKNCGTDPAALMNWQTAHHLLANGCIDAATISAAGKLAGVGAGVAVTEGLRALPSWNKPVLDAKGQPVQSVAGAEKVGEHDIVKRDEEVVGPQITKLAAKIPPGLIHDFVAGFGAGATQAPGDTYRLDARISDLL